MTLSKSNHLYGLCLPLERRTSDDIDAKVLPSANILRGSVSVFYLVPCLKILGGKEINHTEPESDSGSQI